MSKILEHIAAVESHLEKEVAYWRQRAERWEERYWSEKLADIAASEKAHCDFVRQLVEGNLTVTRKES